jgi:RNA polymerase sigma-70 factor (ECF subfamily)
LDGSTELPEVEVITGISDSDFEQLYEEQLRRVYAFLARRVGPTLAEDLAAQTFYEAWVGRSRYDPRRGGAVGWLFGIATNLLRRHRRREDSQLRAFARVGVDPIDQLDESSIVDRLMVHAGWQHVAAALADLSPIDRDILTLAGWARLSYDEIADALDLPMGTVKSRLSRARRHLARRLSPSIDLA